MTSSFTSPKHKKINLGDSLLGNHSQNVMNSIKYLLLKFLSQKQYLMYPIKEARILTFSPLRITDTSGETYLELSYLEEEIKDRFRQQGIDFHDCEFKIVLIEWEFIYCKVPNGTDYYVDIKANKYRIEELEPEEELELDEEGVCITEDIDVAMALGDRQRSQLH